MATTLFIGGLSPRTGDVQLGRYFSKYSDMYKAAVVKNKRYGIVKINADDSCVRRILSELHFVGGWPVMVTLYYPNMGKIALVTNLDERIQLGDLWPHFSYYGPVVAIDQRPDPFTGLLNPSHCYITFEDAEGFHKVVEQHEFWIRGIQLKARPACQLVGLMEERQVDQQLNQLTPSINREGYHS